MPSLASIVPQIRVWPENFVEHHRFTAGPQVTLKSYVSDPAIVLTAFMPDTAPDRPIEGRR